MGLQKHHLQTRTRGEDGVNVTLRYFEGCENWQTTYERLGALGVRPRLERLETSEDAEGLGFVGSPTILVDGQDAFPTARTDFGLSCRVYETPDGLAGSPTIEQLRAVLTGSVPPPE